MVRTSTANQFSAGVDVLQARQRELLEAQTQLTSGKRVSRPSDDPSAAARAERAMAASARADANQRALDTSRQSMTQAEAALGDADELLQQARDQILAAGNGSWGPAERSVAATSLRALRQQLLAVANRDDGAGGFVFAGQGSSSAPFIDAAGGVAWRGSAGTQFAGSQEPLPLSVDGQATWLSAPSGNGVFETAPGISTGAATIDAGRVTDPAALTGDDYAVAFTVSAGVTSYSVTRNGAATALTNVPFASGQAIEIDGLAFTVSGQPAQGDTFTATPSQANLSVFDALDQTIATLSDPLASTAQVGQTVKLGVRDVDAVLSSMGTKRAEAGLWLNRLDAVEQRIANRKLAAQTERSNAEDLDMVQAVSDFQSKQTSYDAALRTYAMVQRMSLFNYLGS